ncbi:hypothetical protein GCM10025877_23600 [Agromyces mangrovi Wang et al. 2018]|nr:hypothetical protein GCM10025877_23600 [Agromyces mangrovi]
MLLRRRRPQCGTSSGIATDWGIVLENPRQRPRLRESSGMTDGSLSDAYTQAFDAWSDGDWDLTMPDGLVPER